MVIDTNNYLTYDQFEEAIENYNNEKYEEVISYYDNLQSAYTKLRLLTYKMASESCIQLASMKKEDSIMLINKSDEIYNEAIKWYGVNRIKEKWDSLKIKAPEEPETFKIIEKQPAFPGGMAALYKYIQKKMKYPKEAKKQGIEGKVFVQFIIDKEGRIDKVRVVQGIGGGCDEEAVRVIKMLPDFTPGMSDGEPIDISMVLPITFRL